VTVEVTAQMVKQLRDTTGAGFQDCRMALMENEGDFARAAEFLRKKGIATAAKKAGRAANDGIIQTYMHHNGRVGVLVEVNSETDFVAQNETFKKFAKELSLHIANMAPRYIKLEDIPQETVERERSAQLAKALSEGKSEAVAAKVVEGRMTKWYEEVVLFEQPWLHDDKLKVKDVLTNLIAEIKENLVIRRFTRYALGEDNSEAE
jgi:elongation factor Ts